MRIGAIILSVIVFAAFTVRADEKLPELKVGEDVYHNVTVTSVTATDLSFNYDKGFAIVKLKNLDPEMQKHFHYDATKAADLEKRRKGKDFTYLLAPNFLETVQRDNAKDILADTVKLTEAIINQPVAKYPDPGNHPQGELGYYPDGWFHPGANRPDFKHVDIRITQEAPYKERRYATSSLNQGVMFLGSEIEFNSNTKYFYIDRSLPKKKLTEKEMEEVNQLYRIIARCEEKLGVPYTR